jgi:hypothetical protein
MTLSDDQFNKAFEIFQEFGLRRRLPIYQRWQEAFPEAGLDDMRDWEKEFKDIEGFAHETAEKVRDDGLDEPSAMHQVGVPGLLCTSFIERNWSKRSWRWHEERSIHLIR